MLHSLLTFNNMKMKLLSLSVLDLACSTTFYTHHKPAFYIQKTLTVPQLKLSLESKEHETIEGGDLY